jgi:uncharacterized protein involved in exopolysaccharide biosynthesis/Mrp family chromosome partitioning ATPase
LPTPDNRIKVQVAPPPAPSSGLSVDDIYYAFFRHKGKILFFTIAGIVAGAISYVSIKPLYISEAKLFVRYVVVDGVGARPSSDGSMTKSPDRGGETIMNSEQEILTSQDLLRQVAEVIGPEKINAAKESAKDAGLAAVVIGRGLSTYAPQFSSVITVRFQHPDVTLVQPVLREIISQYFKNHLEIHRTPGMVGDFLNQETDQLRARLAQTEDELRKARAKAGVFSIDESKKSLAEQTATIRQQIFTAEAELAELNSLTQPTATAAAKPAVDGVVPGGSQPAAPAGTADAPAAVASATSAPAGELSPTGEAAAGSVTPPPAPTQPAVPPGVLENYRGVLARLDLLRRREQEMLLEYTPENPRVKEIQSQIAEVRASKEQLEGDYHTLERLVLPTPAVASGQASSATKSSQGIDTIGLAIRISALQAKIKALKGQLESLRQEVINLDQAEGNIRELMRKKDLEETNYLHYAASLEQNRINEALGSGRVSNITQIQTPSAPFVESTKALKTPGALAGGGLGLGLALALFIELYWDRTVRRPVDVPKKLNLPLFISFPYFGPRRLQRLRFWRRKRKSLGAAPAPIPLDEKASEALALPQGAALVPTAPPPLYQIQLLPFHDTLRDRLIGYFEARELTHKPKLIAVTGINHGVGVTTTAAGLAKSLSETGDGNVLLVDMSPGNGAAQYFHRGNAVCGLEELLATRNNAQVQDRLFVVGNNPDDSLSAHFPPQRFRHLVPKLKASNFDYIIFDMPPVSQISITPRVAGFMDMVLLVTESEKDVVELVQRATNLLHEAKANVGVVLNKTRNYVPVSIHREELGY